MKHAPTLADALLRESFKPSWRRFNPDGSFRNALLQARRFVLDDTMSAFMADLAYSALGKFRNTKRDHLFLEHLRTSARLPHSTTWIEFNMRARGKRAREQYGIGSLDPDKMPALGGWLLETHPKIETAFWATECVSHSLHYPDSDNLYPTPNPSILAWMWCTDGAPLPWHGIRSDDNVVQNSAAAILTGIGTHNSAQIGVRKGHFDFDRVPEEAKKNAVGRLLMECSSDLRYLWALLAAINDLPVSGAHVRPSKGFVARGSYKRFLEHTVITLRIPGNKSMRALAAAVNKAARRRAHQVRGHWRNDFRRPGERLWVKEHQRGDASMGFVLHNYEVKHES